MLPVKCHLIQTEIRYISVPRLVFLLSIVSFTFFWISSKFFGHDSSLEMEEEHSDTMAKRIQEIEKARKAEEDFQRDFRRSLTPNDSTELTMGSYRYKLFKNPILHFKRANTFCKRMDGILAMTPKAENIRKLQQLIGKPDKKEEMEEHYGRHRNAVWVGKEKVKKKKKRKTDEAEDNYMNYMDAGMMGGGRGGEEMCPGISPTSIYVPAPCHSKLPFICEFNKNAPRKPPPDGEEFGKRKKNRFSSETGRIPDEM